MDPQCKWPPRGEQSNSDSLGGIWPKVVLSESFCSPRDPLMQVQGDI